MHKTKIELLGINYYLGLGFLNELISGTGKSLQELSVLEDIALYPILIYHSRVYACKRLDLPIDFTQEDIFDYIDDNGGTTGKFFTEFVKAYFIAMTLDVPEESKKKVMKVRK
jgi:hypothetical protein